LYLEQHDSFHIRRRKRSKNSTRVHRTPQEVEYPIVTAPYSLLKLSHWGINSIQQRAARFILIKRFSAESNFFAAFIRILRFFLALYLLSKKGFIYTSAAAQSMGYVASPRYLEFIIALFLGLWGISLATFSVARYYRQNTVGK